MNDKESQEKYNMERDRYLLVQYLKDLRKAKGITQKELAQKMGCSQQGISKLEHHNSNTTLDTFLGYCHYLGIDIFQFNYPPLRSIDLEARGLKKPVD